MAILESVNDGSTAYLIVSFYDEEGALLTPTSVTYRIDDEEGNQIRGNTAVTPDSTVTIELTKSDNKLTSPADRINVVTILASWESGAKQIISEYRYKILYLPEREHLYA